MSSTPEAFRKAQRHLTRRDPILKALIKLVGPCTLQHDPDRFAILARSIVSQQISTKAARAISGRLEKALGRKGITAAGILKMPEPALREVGLSANKCRSILDLAEKVHSGLVPLQDFDDLPDEEVIAKLIPVRGIGRWTAEMFLIFSLGRMDVLPVDDFGFRVGVQKQYGLKEMPVRKHLQELAEPWRPFRTIGTWYIWRSLGNVPQSEKDGK
jgi:DNA-3-methyladenine glycosylase II